MSQAHCSAARGAAVFGRVVTALTILSTFVVLPALLVAQPAPAGVAKPQSRTLYLVRHGHYEADPKADPILGPGLSTLGVAQARLAGARLAGLPFRFDRASASPLTRADQTARVILSDLPGLAMDTVAELAECTPPTWRQEVLVDEPVEKQKACAQGLDKLFAERFVPVPAGGVERRELLVAHGNVIRYLTTKALKVDTLSWLEMSPGHASVTVIRVEADGRFKLIALGDVGHIAANLQTGSTGNPERALTVPVQAATAIN
jgi:serine/threonine-protein phosphatase PGAM5